MDGIPIRRRPVSVIARKPVANVVVTPVSPTSPAVNEVRVSPQQNATDSFFQPQPVPVAQYVPPTTTVVNEVQASPQQSYINYVVQPQSPPVAHYAPQRNSHFFQPQPAPVAQYAPPTTTVADQAQVPPQQNYINYVVQPQSPLAAHYAPQRNSPRICNNCKGGIPYDTPYSECGWCNIPFCNACANQHAAGHQQTMTRLISRETYSGTLRDGKHCGQCKKNVHVRYDCRACPYSICFNCYNSVEGPRHGHKDYLVIEPVGKAVGIVDGLCRDCIYRPNLGHCDRCLTSPNASESILSCRTCEMTFDESISLCRKCHLETAHMHDPTHQWISSTLQICTDAAAKRGVFGCSQCDYRAHDFKTVLSKHHHNSLVVYLGPATLEIVLQSLYISCQRKPSRADNPKPLVGTTCWSCDWCGKRFPTEGPHRCKVCPDFGLCSTCFPGASYLHKHGNASFAPSTDPCFVSRKQVAATGARGVGAPAQRPVNRKPFKLGIKALDKHIEKLDKNGKVTRGVKVGGEILSVGVSVLKLVATADRVVNAASGGGGGGGGDGGGDGGGGGGDSGGFDTSTFVAAEPTFDWSSTQSAASDPIQ